ncbi:hypothetical protein [Paralcaligenes ginsengisoli]
MNKPIPHLDPDSGVSQFERHMMILTALYCGYAGFGLWMLCVTAAGR